MHGRKKKRYEQRQVTFKERPFGCRFSGKQFVGLFLRANRMDALCIWSISMTKSNTKTYAEKLKDPRWQKKRLHLLELARWECENCHSDSSTLHVHHVFYESKRQPWEYEDNDFMVLCETCHQAIQDKCNSILRMMAVQSTYLVTSGSSCIDYYDMIEKFLRWQDGPEPRTIKGWSKMQTIGYAIGRMYSAMMRVAP